jgi:RND family efflux transporter MFP subunit
MNRDAKARVGLLGLTLLAALCVVGMAGCSRSASADDDDSGGEKGGSPPSALVHVTPLQKGSLPSVVTLYGIAQGSAGSRQSITAPASARVAAVNVRLGESVSKDQPLLQLAPTPATSASYAQARSALRVAEQGLASTRSLLAQHLATNQQLNDALKAEADARATLASLQAQGAAGMTVRAPFAATVTSLSASVGMLVNEGTALLDLARRQGLVLQAGAVPHVATGIHVNDAARITPIGATGMLQGKVMLRGAVVDPGTGLVPIEISLPPDSMLPGEQAVAEVTTGEAQGYLVPHAAVLINDEGNPYIVQVIGAMAKKVAVRVLGTMDDRDAITGAVTPSAPVVVEGNYQLEDGMKVRVAGAAARSAP